MLNDASPGTVKVILTSDPHHRVIEAPCRTPTGRRAVAEAQSQAKEPACRAVPPLSASVRRHLGKSLRSFYAASLAEPVSERLEALLSRLDTPKR